MTSLAFFFFLKFSPTMPYFHLVTPCQHFITFFYRIGQIQAYSEVQFWHGFILGLFFS